MSNDVAVAASRTRVKQPTFPVSNFVLPRTVADDEATMRFVPVPPANVTSVPAVVVAFLTQNF